MDEGKDQRVFHLRQQPILQPGQHGKEIDKAQVSDGAYEKGQNARRRAERAAIGVKVEIDIDRELKEKYNTSMILITHDLGVVSQMATKLAVMKDGRVIETSDDPAAFFASPGHPYTQALVREARRMELST